MKKYKKKELLDMIHSLERANDTININRGKANHKKLIDVLTQCQESAIFMGNYIETLGEKVSYLVRILENYCENIYQMSISLDDNGKCKQLAQEISTQLSEFKKHIKYDLPEERKEVVFLPYKASMWDSLESVWKAANEDVKCDAYVIPIPYYDKNPDGSFGEIHYEGDQYPDYVPITNYEKYDFEERRPDVIFIHNPYDEYNRVTSVHPFFYSKNLKQYTEKLVYIPYFILEEINPDDQAAIAGMRHFCTTPGVFNADEVIVQSENMKLCYVQVMTKFAGEHTKAIWEKKILGTGSPKLDKVQNTKKDDVQIPEEWKKLMLKSDGNYKKVILYNTSVSALLEHSEKMLDKIQSTFEIFKDHIDEVVLLWRPHPLIKATIESMRPQLWVNYEKIVNQYRTESWGIYDDSAELDRAIVLSDAYYGDQSSLVQLCQKVKMPVMIQNVEILEAD